MPERVEEASRRGRGEEERGRNRRRRWSWSRWRRGRRRGVRRRRRGAVRMLVTSLEMCKAMQGRRRVDELVVEEVADWESSHNSSPVDRSSHYYCPFTNLPSKCISWYEENGNLKSLVWKTPIPCFCNVLTKCLHIAMHWY